MRHNPVDGTAAGDGSLAGFQAIRHKIINMIMYRISSKLKSGAFSQVVVAVNVFTVTFGGTQADTNYQVVITPTAAVFAAVHYVTNKTTTTFDVTYVAGLTGNVTFDWVMAR